MMVFATGAMVPNLDPNELFFALSELISPQRARSKDTKGVTEIVAGPCCGNR
jgi:hypothetical protein